MIAQKKGARMSRNILLTSLDTLESDRALRYYSVQNEFGFRYCDAVQSMEASTKYILARYPIDEILVLGGEGASDNGNKTQPLRLKDAGALCSSEPGSLSGFDLYRLRIAQYIDERNPEQQAYDALLPEEERAKLIDFTRSSPFLTRAHTPSSILTTRFLPRLVSETAFTWRRPARFQRECSTT